MLRYSKVRRVKHASVDDVPQVSQRLLNHRDGTTAVVIPETLNILKKEGSWLLVRDDSSYVVEEGTLRWMREALPTPNRTEGLANGPARPQSLEYQRHLSGLCPHEVGLQNSIRRFAVRGHPIRS